MTEVFQLAIGAKQLPLRSCLLRGGGDELVDFAYSFWLVRLADALMLVDCGFHEPAAARKSIVYERTPVEALALMGVAPEQIDLLVLTHLHFDHAGALADFPRAEIVVQRSDLDYFRGPLMRFPLCASGIDQDDMAALARAQDAGRVRVLDGDTDLGGGVSTIEVGGHTPGSQLVRVETPSGSVVLTGDAAHLRTNFELGTPFPVLHSVPSACVAFERMAELERDGAQIIPGHDGVIRATMPAVEGIADNAVVRLGGAGGGSMRTSTTGAGHGHR